MIGEKASEPATQDYYRRGLWRAETLWRSLDRATGKNPDATIRDADREITLSGLMRMAERIAGALQAAGVWPGDVVLVQSRNSIEAFAAILSCFAGGLVAAPLPPMFSARQVADIAVSANARALFILDGDAEGVMRALAARDAPLPALFVPDASANPPALRPWSSCVGAKPAASLPAGADEPAFVLHSSGSMGRPKGVIHSGNTLRFAVESVAARHNVGPADTVLVALEFGFVGGTVLSALLALIAGARVVLMRRWDAEHALHLIARYGVTYSLFMPTHCHDLFKITSMGPTNPRKLPRAIMAGLTREARREAMATFCDAPLAMFGMSEAIGHVTTALDDPLDARLTTEGRALKNSEILICADGEEPLPAGQPGSLLVRGPNRFLAYLGEPELTSDAMTPRGWFRTGDKAFVDERGFMTFLGREKDIIRRAGMTIVPADVENLLIAHPDIVEVAVVAVPDARLGEQACACIVARPDARVELSALTSWLGSRNVARYLWPEHILVLPSLPRTPSLKVRRADLAETARAAVSKKRDEAGH